MSPLTSALHSSSSTVGSIIDETFGVKSKRHVEPSATRAERNQQRFNENTRFYFHRSASFPPARGVFIFSSECMCVRGRTFQLLVLLILGCWFFSEVHLLGFGCSDRWPGLLGMTPRSGGSQPAGAASWWLAQRGGPPIIVVGAGREKLQESCSQKY